MNILRFGMMIAAAENSSVGEGNNLICEFKKRIKSSQTCNFSLSIKRAFMEYGITSLWHMTHYSNVPGILNNGLLSHLDSFSVAHSDISDADVKNLRYRREPYYKKQINSFVPLYINTRNPMLYLRRNIQNEICILEINIAAMAESKFIFSDGNAASYVTNFFNKIDDLNRLPWDVINASYWSGYPDGKRKRCSEVLLQSPLPAKFIKDIHCNNYKILDWLHDHGIAGRINKRLFFDGS